MASRAPMLGKPQANIAAAPPPRAAPAIRAQRSVGREHTPAFGSLPDPARIGGVTDATSSEKAADAGEGDLNHGARRSRAGASHSWADHGVSVLGQRDPSAEHPAEHEATPSADSIVPIPRPEVLSWADVQEPVQ